MKILCIFLLLAVCAGCGNNTNPPEYIKDVVAHKEGSGGIAVYVILADKDGNPTSADGILRCDIETKRKSGERFSPVFNEVKSVKTSDFSVLIVGAGAFEHKILGYPLSRFVYSDFDKSGSWLAYPDLNESFGRVRVTFTVAPGKQLEGETPISF